MPSLSPACTDWTRGGLPGALPILLELELGSRRGWRRNRLFAVRAEWLGPRQHGPIAIQQSTRGDSPLRPRFEAAIVDWDGTAVPDRAADASEVRMPVEEACALGMHIGGS